MKAQKVLSVRDLSVPVLTLYSAEREKHSKGGPRSTGSTDCPTHVALAGIEVVVADAVVVAVTAAVLIYSDEENVE